MQLSRKHHFIAESILKRFQSKTGTLWVYDHARRASKGIEQRSPSNCFWIANDNSVLNEQAKAANDDLERDYSALDQEWKNLTDQFINNDHFGRFTFSDKGNMLREMIYLQVKRSPDINKKSDESFDYEAEIMGHDLDIDERNYFLAATNQKRLRQNATISARRQMNSSINLYLEQHFPAILKIPKTSQKNFIIGSCIMTNAVLPISPKHAIFMSKNERDFGKKIILSSSNEKLIDEINFNTANKSEFGVASGYRNTLQEIYTKIYPRNLKLDSSRVSD